ncbi:MAG: DUF1801 domain-containing protein [Gemmatimonadales bacterium]
MKQSKAVAAWLESYDNPMNEVVRRVRDIILHADPRIKESLDGDAPTFSYRGTLASIFPESKKHASLMVERGAEIPGHHPRLEGSNDPRRVMKIHDLAEANAAKDDLQHLVRAWCDWRDAEAPAAEEPTARAKKKPAAKKKRAAPRKKAARPAAKKARTAKKTARPAAKKSGAKKAAAKKSRTVRKSAAKPRAKKTSKRPAGRSRGR